MKVSNIKIDELNPYVRRAGIQGLSYWENKFRRIYDYELMYCINGHAHYQTQHESYSLTAGDLLLIRPDTPHKFWVDRQFPSKLIWAHFDFIYRADVYELDKNLVANQSQMFEEVLPKEEYLREDYIIENRFKLPTLISINKKSIVEALFVDIYENYSNHTTTWQFAAKADLLLILKSVIDQLSSDPQRSTDHVKLSQQIHDYIQQHYFRKISRKDIANYLGYHPDYVGKTFIQSYKQTISTYTNQLRVAKAKELLMNSDLTIENISELVGYSDVSYFSNIMKKHTGYYPGMWKVQKKARGF